MNRLSQNLIALAACAAMLVSGGSAGAQGRAAPVRKPPAEARADEGEVLDPAVRAKKLAELDAWLRRLVGHYRVDGNVDQLIGADLRRSRGIKGVADCTAVGDGPGVRCLIDATWAPIFLIRHAEHPDGSDSTFANKFTLHPSIFLFGLNPEAEAIRVLEVDDHSIAVEAGGVIQEDNKLEYLTTCPAIDYKNYCRKVRVTAKPGRNVVSIEIEVFGSPHFNLLLHRLSTDQADEASSQ